MGAAEIIVDGVVRSFGKRRVLDGVSLTVAPGRFVAVVGPSGTGKSTLLHLVAGLLRPEAGLVLVDGERVDTLGDDDAARLRRERLGFVFQAYNLLPVLTARENVALPGRIAGWARRTAEERADVLLERLGLAHVAGQRPGELSGGEQQRVAVARALLMRPGAVLADEPTGSLDAATGTEVLVALRDAAGEESTTVLLVTHDPQAAAAADDVVRLDDCRVTSQRRNRPAPSAVAR